jgi:carbonic anhydrase
MLMNIYRLNKSVISVLTVVLSASTAFAESESKPVKSAASVKAEKEDKSDSSGKGESKSKSKSEAKGDAKSDSKSDSKADSKADAKAESKSELKPNKPVGGSTLIRELTVEQLQEALSNYKKTGAKLKIDIGAAGGAHKDDKDKAHRSATHHPLPARSQAAAPKQHDSAHDKLAAATASGGDHADPAFDQNASREYIKARAAALTEKSPGPGIPAHSAALAGAAATHGVTAHGAAAQGNTAPGTTGPAAPAHWGYEGAHGPQAWAQMKPEFGTCASGKRQSPIHIEDTTSLQGPAEALQINYQASGGTVVNNGHTIQVDVVGENTLTVRGATYKLVQFHAHHPAEERVNNKSFSMVMHLVHRSAEGKLAVIAVLMDPGPANLLIQKVWTHMPLDVQDKVRMPSDLINLNDLLPVDRRYYQFMGSLTTPPCTEGVLWMVLKQPVTLSREQLRVFAQLFPNNARPVQPLQGRIVRNAE